MDSIIITISSELFDDDPSQEAQVRRNLPVRGLIAEVQREFGLPEGSYFLLVKGSNRRLEADKTLEQLGIQQGAELVFERERRRAARPASAPVTGGTIPSRRIVGSQRAFLKEEDTGRTFDIEWQPAIIGRPDAGNPASAQMLAINLGGFEEARSVSRQHGRITEREGKYFVESLAEKNPVILNGDEVSFGEKRGLKPGDRLLFGKIALVFDIRPAAG